jgi:hypothetical protein
MADTTLPPAYRALESLCGDGDGVDVDRIRDPDADAYAEQKLGLTSAMRKSTNGSNPSGIASNPPDAAHSFNPQQVKDDPTSQQWVLPEGPGSVPSIRALRSTHQVGKRSHRPSDKGFCQQGGKGNLPATAS